MDMCIYVARLRRLCCMYVCMYACMCMICVCQQLCAALFMNYSLIVLMWTLSQKKKSKFDIMEAVLVVEAAEAVVAFVVVPEILVAALVSYSVVACNQTQYSTVL